MNNRFFTWVWRLNGLVLALLLLWVLFFAFGTLVDEVFDRDAPPAALTAAGNPTDEEAPLVLRGPLNNTNSGLYVLPLAVQSNSRGSDLSFSSKYSVRQNSVLNYQIINVATEKAHWLFDGNAQMIVETREVKPPSYSSNALGLGHILSVVEADTDGDEYLTRDDLITLYFVPRDWDQAQKLVEGVQNTLSITAPSVASLDIILEDADGIRLRRFGLPLLDPQADIPLQ